MKKRKWGKGGLDDLSKDSLRNITLFLECDTLKKLKFVSMVFYLLVKDPITWKIRIQNNPIKFEELVESLEGYSNIPNANVVRSRTRVNQKIQVQKLKLWKLINCLINKLSSQGYFGIYFHKFMPNRVTAIRNKKHIKFPSGVFIVRNIQKKYIEDEKRSRMANFSSELFHKQMVLGIKQKVLQTLVDTFKEKGYRIGIKVYNTKISFFLYWNNLHEEVCSFAFASSSSFASQDINNFIV